MVNTRNIIINNTHELKKLIEANKVYIYGTGFIGKKFYYSLKKNQLENHVVGFVTTDLKEEMCCGINVSSVVDVSRVFEGKDNIMCIATHESSLTSICRQLEENHIEEYVWIYPFFHDLIFGEPIKTGVEININDILRSYRGNYAIPIRYLAIEQFYGKNVIGYEIYKKGMQLHCNKNTAEIRLEKYVTLMKDWDKNGYNPKSRIKITDNKDIFDGVHRLTLALYHGQKTIKCDMYRDDNDEYERLISNVVKIPENELGVFSQKETKYLKEVYEKIYSAI